MRNGRVFKKDDILDLVYNKKKSVREAAQALDTSESYVRKVLSLNKINLSNSSRSTLEDEASTNISEMDLNDKQRGQKKNIPPSISQMKPELRKALYRWLDGRKPLTGFVKRTGIDGQTAEAEYNTYLKLKGTDRYDLQRDLLISAGYEEDEIEPIISSALDRLLSNSSLIDHVEKRKKVAMEAHVESAMERFAQEEESKLPLFFIRPECSLCGSSLLGILIYKMNGEGRTIAEYLSSNYKCNRCKQGTEYI